MWNDPILAIAAYWRVVHKKCLLQQAARHPSWLVIAHEDLSRRADTNLSYPLRQTRLALVLVGRSGISAP